MRWSSLRARLKADIQPGPLTVVRLGVLASLVAVVILVCAGNDFDAGAGFLLAVGGILGLLRQGVARSDNVVGGVLYVAGAIPVVVGLVTRDADVREAWFLGCGLSAGLGVLIYFAARWTIDASRIEDEAPALEED